MKTTLQLLMVVVLLLLHHGLCRVAKEKPPDEEQTAEKKRSVESPSNTTVGAKESEQMKTPSHGRFEGRAQKRNNEHDRFGSIENQAKADEKGVSEDGKSKAKAKLGENAMSGAIPLRKEVLTNESYIKGDSVSKTKVHVDFAAETKAKPSKSNVSQNTSWIVQSVTPWCSKKHIVHDRGHSRVPRYRMEIECNGKETTCRKGGRPACTAMKVYLDVLILRGYTSGPNPRPIYQHSREIVVRDCVCTA